MGVVRQSVEVTVREHVRALFQSRAGLKQHEFAEAIQVTPSWVSAFLAGRRNANDLPLLVRIARYFGVNVGYLLGESERGRDAGALTLLETYEKLSESDRAAVLQLALALRRGGGGPGDEGLEPPPSESGGAKRRGR